MIRPSALNLASHCTLSPVLSEKFGKETEGAQHGTNVDAQVKAVLEGRDVPSIHPDAAACLAWIECKRAEGWQVVLFNDRVTVYDPETGAVLTRGTPDLGLHRGDEILLVDLKKKEQFWVGNLPPIDEDLQTQAYALAFAERSQALSFSTAFLLFGDGEAEAKQSRAFPRWEWGAIYDKIREIQTAPIRATRGPHCLKCYGREHCPAWFLPAHEGATALEPFTRPQGLTAETAPKALEVVRSLKEAVTFAEDMLKEYARKNGGIVVGDRRWAPVVMPGRETADVERLKKDGLTGYLRQGGGYEQFRWLRARD